MAYAALLSALQVLNKATIQNYFHNLFTIKHQITTLHEKFFFLQDFLDNDPSEGGEVIDSFEERIRDVAYRVEDVIELHVQNQIRPTEVKSNKDKIFRFYSYEKLYQDFQNVMDEVNSVVDEVMVIKESRKIGLLQRSDFIDEDGRKGRTNVVGFDDDVMILKNQLCGGTSNLEIIPLVGMAGIGKTTLAANVFHDPYIEYYFHVRAWTTITQDHRVPNILKGLLHSMIKEDACLGCDHLDELVYKSLKGRRYLVVLDDIWSTKAWDEVKMLFPNDHNGSRIILTTRLVDVAVHANSLGNFHQMQFLNEKQSWNLLNVKVFGNECCPNELKETGKSIARNCRGLPLSIIVVAGLLKMNKVKHAWEIIARDVSLVVVTASNEHLPTKILSLSYNHLPHHLKPCFLSMGGFPEDYEIPVFNLIRLWVAEGFLRPMQSKSLEQVAEVYLDDLVKRSLVLITKKRSDAKSKFCSIHDLLRDLCIKKGWEEKFLHPMNGIQESMDHKRRIWFSKSVEWFHFMNAAANTTRSSVRSVFCCSYNDKVLVGFHNLKVLHILEVYFKSFPVEVLHLVHLKLIAFASGFIRYCTLPPSLPRLRNLQTLIVSSSVKFNENEYRLVAPLPIWDMPKLRHLVFLNISLTPAPFFTQKSPLRSLQTLSRLRNFRFTREAIEMIPNLKKLKAIYTFSDPCSLRSEYELDNLVHFHQLETLNLCFLPSIVKEHITAVSFSVPLTIKNLTLRGCGISWKDMSIIGSLLNLEVLKLRCLSVVGEEWEAVEGDFPMLRFLLMERLDLSRWMAEAEHFSKLECLIIRHCSRLENIPNGIGEIPTLQVIEMDDCTPSAVESAKEILDEQVSMGNDLLQLRIH